jgi:hypothetical protein
MSGATVLVRPVGIGASGVRLGGDRLVEVGHCCVVAAVSFCVEEGLVGCQE